MIGPNQKFPMKKLGYIFASIFILCSTSYANLIVLNKNTKLWVQQYGLGKPTVILINGGGDTIDTEWTKIIPLLSKMTSILAYDRPGQIKSAPLANLRPVTAKAVVNTLRQLLYKLHIKPPYVLVAHSSGALYAQYFARNYPNQIKGLVIINGNLVTEQLPQTVPWMPKKTVRFVHKYNNQHLVKMENELNTIHPPYTKKQIAKITYILEVMGKQKSAEEILHSPLLSKNLALAVLVSGTYPLEIKLQRDFADQIPNTFFKQYPHASHYIQNNDPKSVSKIIKRIIERVKEADKNE